MDNFFYNYPDIITDTSDFNLDIYKKYEFTSLQSDTTSPGLMRHQKIVSRFMNGNTDYDSLLLYHGLGTGKCVHPNSMVYITEMDIKQPITMNDLWEKYYNSKLIEPDIDTKHAYWLNINSSVYIDSISQDNTICIGKVTKMYKQYIKDEFVNIINSKSIDGDQEILICTKRHKLLIANNDKKFTTEYNVGDFIVGQKGKLYQITSIYVRIYTGWMFDLEVESHHSYLVNNVYTHNTCSSIAISEKLHDAKKVRKTLVLTRGGALEKQYIEQLVNVCTIPANKYKDPSHDKLNEETQTRRSKKMFKKYYEFDSYIKFVKRLQKIRKQSGSDEEYKEKLNNIFDGYLFIIDEAHNIRPNFDDKFDVYKEIHKLFHSIESRRVLLLSGTPIKDKVYEISYIMNLLLPMDMQLPLGKDFIQKYVDTTTKQFKKDSVSELRKYFTGKISFFRANFESIQQIEMGKPMGKLKYLKVDPSYMSNIQTAIYMKALEQDVSIGHNKKGKGIFSNSRQASLCVDKNGNWGNKINIESIVDDMKHAKNSSEKLKIIEIYSCKYAEILSSVIYNTNQNIFIYNTFVKGSGIHIFKRFLEQFGYTRSIGKEHTPGLRYAVITNELSNPTRTMNILKLFNSDKNKHGEYIQLIIGSKVANEGLTMKNVRQVHIVAPYWNFTDIEQAIARTIRMNSHKALIDDNELANVGIHLHSAIPKDGTLIDVDVDDDWDFDDLEEDLASDSDSDKDSVASLNDSDDSDIEEVDDEIGGEIGEENKIKQHQTSYIPLQLENIGKDLKDNLSSIDLYMYYTSEQKDVQNKTIERQMKEMSFDCLLNLDNNTIQDGVDGSRACDYTSCVLQCNNQSDLSKVKNIKIEFDSYNILYDYEYKSKIIKCLNRIFQNRKYTTLKQIMDFCQDTSFTEIQLKYTISDMVVNAIPIKDKYGMQYYIEYNSDDDIRLVYTFNKEDTYYENVNWMQVQDNSINNFMKKFTLNKDIVIVNKIAQSTDDVEKWKLIKQISGANFDELLKTAIMSTTTPSTPLKSWILQTFDSLIVKDVKMGGDIYITRNTFTPWKYDQDTKKWMSLNMMNASDDINTMNSLLIDKFCSDGFLYYAIYNDNTKTLFLRSTKDLAIMRKGKGKDCISFNLIDLLKDVIIPGNIIIPGQLIPDNKILQKVEIEFKSSKLTWSPETLQTVYNVLMMNKDEICTILKDWFQKHGKLQITL